MPAWLTPEKLAILTLLITTIGGLAVAWLQANGKTREAKIVEAIVKGVEAGAAAATGDPTNAGRIVKAAIKSSAEALGVQADLAVRVKTLTDDGEPPKA